MSMERLPFEHRPRNSIANNLDKINELVDWVNLDTHLYASASGERVTVDDASSVKGLMVDGRSVQDGTPTPDAPVPVQVVGGKNLLDWRDIPSRTNNGVIWKSNGDGWIRATGTASGGYSYGLGNPTVQALDSGYIAYCEPGTYTASGDVAFNVYAMNSDVTGISLRAYSTNPYTFTLTEPKYIQLGPRVENGTATNTIYHLQLEKGSIATPYIPYGSISIVVGDTVTPINLQGNILASLPDGTQDELHIDSAGRVWIDKLVGHTTQAVTDGVTGTVGTDVLSSTGQIADGADVWYKLTAQQTINLGYITPPAIPSGSVVTVSASMTPTIHLDWWVDDGITELVNDLIAYIDYKTEG